MKLFTLKVLWSGSVTRSTPRQCGEHAEAAQATRLYFVGVARYRSAVTGRQLVHAPGDADDVPGLGEGGLDAIALAASQTREHTEHPAVTEVGPGTVEQFRADVVRLGRAYVSAPPLPLFAAMHQALNRVQAALRRRMYPDQARDLNFLAGALCGLMANASLDLGREEAADDLARAAWTHGRVIDNGPRMGWARAPRRCPRSGIIATSTRPGMWKTAWSTCLQAQGRCGCMPSTPGRWPCTGNPRRPRPP